MNVPLWSIVKKTLSVFLTVMMILSVNFYIFYIVPGDPAHALIPKGVSPEDIELFRDGFTSMTRSTCNMLTTSRTASRAI